VAREASNIPRWFAGLKMVTHPSTDRAQFVGAMNAVTITACCHYGKRNRKHETYSSVGKLSHKLLISLTHPTFLPLTFQSLTETETSKVKMLVVLN